MPRPPQSPPRVGARFPKSESRMGGELVRADKRVEILRAALTVAQASLDEATQEADAIRAEIAGLVAL